MATTALNYVNLTSDCLKLSRNQFNIKADANQIFFFLSLGIIYLCGFQQTYDV